MNINGFFLANFSETLKEDLDTLITLEEEMAYRDASGKNNPYAPFRIKPHTFNTPQRGDDSASPTPPRTFSSPVPPKSPDNPRYRFQRVLYQFLVNFDYFLAA